MDFEQIAAEISALVQKELAAGLAPVLARLDALENAEAKETPAPVMPQPKVIIMPPPQDNREREILVHRDSAGRMDGAVSRVKQ